MGNAVFILASERSGTNLLRRRLSEAQSLVIGPAPLHLLKHLYFAEPYYGDLNCNTVFTQFVADGLNLAYEHFSAWDEQITTEEVIRRYDEFFEGSRSAIGLMHVIYMLYASRKGFDGYICKDNHLHEFAAEIMHALPFSRFVYLHRDPRDVILSQFNRPLQVKSYSYLSLLWRDEQIKCIRAVKTIAPTGRLDCISYEELITDEATVLQRLCRSLGLDKKHSGSGASKPFQNEAIEVDEWKNLNRPTMTGNFGKFEDELSNSTIRRIESIVWWQMTWLGYTPKNATRPRVRKFVVEFDALFGRVKRAIKNRLRLIKATDGQKRRTLHTSKILAKWK